MRALERLTEIAENVKDVFGYFWSVSDVEHSFIHRGLGYTLKSILH